MRRSEEEEGKEEEKGEMVETTQVVMAKQDGQDFLFLFDLLAHSCGLESTLRSVQ